MCYFFIQRRKTIQLGMQIGDVVCEPKEFLLKTLTIARIRDGAATMPANRSPRAVALLRAMEKSREVPVKVYTTEILSGDTLYGISTGSKEIHLELGRMTGDARKALVDLIDHETEIGSELLLVFQHENVSRGFICVKHVRRPDRLVLMTLQLANN